MVQFAIVGNRVPHKYFLTKGAGESNAGSKYLPAETGSYDAALKDANLATPESIEANFNQIKNLNDGDINGPGNLSLGRMLEDRLSKL